MHDVVIIGAGIVGCVCARYLSAFDLDTVVVEAGYDIACGTTRANSGIVHGGYDPKPGTKKAKYNIAGSRMYPELAEELGFDFKNNGSLVVAFAQEEIPALEELLERGRANGVEGLRILTRDELHAKEPNLSRQSVAALWVPTGGIVDPYGAALAFAENAAVNGVNFIFDTLVTGLKLEDGRWKVTVRDEAEGESRVIESKFVINAAGLHSGEVNSMASEAEEIRITPRVGEYVLLDNVWGDSFTSTVFQVPTAKGKGVLVTPTVEGNILIGPNAVAREGFDETQTTAAGLDEILGAAKKTWENIPVRDVITNFAGLRSTCVESPDFHLGEPDDAPGFFNVAGFDSPGLTAAPAVAEEFAQVIANRLDARRRDGFVAARKTPRHFSRMTDDERAAAIAEDPAWGRIVCRCECVSEAEIVEACNSPVPARTTDAIKWRTRAGMGRCQAGFCLPLQASIIARQHGIELEDVEKGPRGSWLSVGKRGCLDALPQVVMEGGAS